MTNIDSLAEALFGSKRAETQEVLTDATTRTYIGIALTDSVDGTVMVDLGGDVTLPDDIEGVSEYSAEGVEVATGPGVRAGDEVVVTLVGGTPLKTPMVTGVAGEGDGQDARIATASAAAEAAWDWADDAHDAATDAQESADAAQASAESAASAASAAVISAASAEASAQQAIGDAAAASSAAASAQASAQQAIEDASDAHDAAVAAQAEATLATQSANEAKGAATRANTAANDALTQLATVEDVIGVVDWVTEHGTYSLTTDTAIDPDKVYYTRTGSGTQADPYVYEAVAEPDVSDIGSYYELDIDEALSQYVASHLALTNAGLYVLKDSSGYKLLLANDGMRVIDPAGHTVATYGESITFDSERPQRIGGTDSYIEWRDTDSDGVPDSLAIVADSIELSGGQSVSTGSGNVWANHSSATSASGISSWSDTFVAPTTAKPYVWMKSYSIIDGQRVYGNPACITGAKGADGTSVSVTSIEYATSTTETQPSSGWTTTAPSTVAEGSWLWTRVNYSDGSTAVSRAKQGVSGTSGSSSYTHVRYSAQSDGTGFVTTPTASTVYIGIAITTSSTAPTAKSSYTWSRYVGQQGAQGPQGETGDTGVGIQSYAQMWAKSTSNSVAPTSGWSASRPTSIGTNEYLWVRIDTTWTDNTTTQGTPVVDQNTTDLWHTSAALRVDVDSIGSDVSALQTTVSGHTTTISQHTTAIQQNTDAIALRATKTEASQMAQPNLSPYFSACQNTDFFTNSNYPIISSELGAIGTQLSDGWLHVDMDNSARTSAAYLNTWLKKPSWAKNSTEYTWLIEVRNFTLTSGSYVRFSPAQNNSAAQTNVTGYVDVTANGSYYAKSTTRADATTNSAYTTFSRGLMQANAGVNASFDVRYSVYEGDYSGPYKPYGGDGFYATSAELKVQTDRIGMVVSNTDASSSLALTADAMTYIGNHVEIKGTDGTSTVISGGKIQANSLTLGAMTTDAQADILNSNVQVGGRNLLLWTGESNTYSDHSAVDRRWDFTVIYGTNVIEGNTVTFTKNGNGLTNNTSGIRVSSMLASGATATTADETSLSFGLTLVEGDTYTFSCDVKTSGNRVAMHAQYFNGTNRWQNCGAITEYGAPVDTDWHRYSHTFTVNSAYVSLTALGIYCELTEGVTISARNFKLERGNKATDWSPAPEDQTEYVDNSINAIGIGGRNLAKGTATQASLTQTGTSRWFDPIAIFPTSDVGLALLNNSSNEKFVLSFDWAATGVTTAFGMDPALKYTSTSYNPISTAYEISVPTGDSSGHYEKVFTPTDAMRSYGNAWLIRRSTATANTSGTVSISNFMFECANKASTWTPAPEDMATAESLAGTNESLDGAIADIGELSDQLTDSVTEQGKTITDIQTYLNSLRQDLDAEIQSRQQWLNFNSAEGLVIGAAGSTFKTVTTNTSQQFRSGGTVLAETSGTEFVAPVMRSDQLLIGNWMWARRDNGNLSLKWIG